MSPSRIWSQFVSIHFSFDDMSFQSLVIKGDQACILLELVEGGGVPDCITEMHSNADVTFVELYI